MVGAEPRGPNDRARLARGPAGERTVAPSAATARPWSAIPRRRAARGLEPTSASRPRIRRPSRESRVLSIRPVAVRGHRAGAPVPGALELVHGGVEGARERGHAWDLERADRLT